MDDELFRKAEPLLGREKARQLWMAASTDPKLKADIESYLSVLIATQLDSHYSQQYLLLPPPPSEAGAGEYVLGDVLYGDRVVGKFGLREQEWLRHVIVVGTSGSGKSNNCFLIACQLIEHNKPFLLFDWKRSSREMLATDWGQNVMVFTVGRPVSPFYFNPLIPPPRMLPTTWLRMLIQVIEHAFYVGFGVAFVLKRAIDYVYKEFGVYEAFQKAGGTYPEDMQYPVFKDVLEYVESLELRGRKAGWQDSAERAIDLLCFPELSHVLNVRRPFPLEKLLEKHVILELDALTDPDKVFLTETLLLWIYQNALGRTTERETFRHAMIIEEAHHILTKKKQDMSGEETIVDRMVRMFRELGEAFVILDQSPSLISNTAMANTYCTIGMNLKHESDINAAANTMLLSADEKRFLGQLPVGTGVVKLQDRWPRPFLVRFPHCGILKGSVTDDQIAKLHRSHPVEVVERGRSGLFSEPVRRDNDWGKKEERRKQKAERNRQLAMVRLLNDVVGHPESSFTERMKRLILSGYRAEGAKTTLLLKGLVREEEAAGPSGRIQKRLRLTPEGQKYLADHAGMLEQTQGTRRHGGKVHQEILQQLKARLESEGWKVELEHSLGGGKKVDLHAERSDASKPAGVRRIAIEVETGEGREQVVVNAQKCLDAGYDHICLLGTDQAVTEGIQSSLRIAGLEWDKRIEPCVLGSKRFT
jgi:hypothetical protein